MAGLRNRGTQNKKMEVKRSNRKLKRKINFRYNFSQYWSVMKDYRYVVLGLMLLTLFGGMLAVVDKFLFKIIVDDGTSFVAGNTAADIFAKTLLIIAIVYIGVTLVRTLVEWMQVHVLVRLDASIIFNLKKKFFNHIVGLDHGFHTTHKTGSLISRLNRGANATEQMTDIIAFNFAPLFFQLVVVGGSLAYFDIAPALVVLATAIVFVLYSFYIQHKMQDSKLRENRAEDYEKGFISDVFTNIDSVKYFGKEEYIGKNYRKVSDNSRKLGIEAGNFYRWLDGGQAFILGVGTFFLIYFPLMKFLNGGLSLGTLVFIYAIY